MRVASTDRRRAAFYITARSCDARAARGLVSRCLRSMLGSGHARAPYLCQYESAAQLGRDLDCDPRLCLARYSAQLTDVECEAVRLAIAIEAEREGWAVVPMQWSHKCDADH